MIKLMGAVMTGSACAFWGFRMRMVLKKRKDSLAKILASLEILEGEISFGVSRLKNAFMRADEDGIFSLAAENIDELGAERALVSSAGKMRQSLCLAEADVSIIHMLAARIGKTDAEDQIKNIRYVKSLLLAQKKQAEEDYTRLSRLYSGGGILIGMFIVILLA